MGHPRGPPTQGESCQECMIKVDFAKSARPHPRLRYRWTDRSVPDERHPPGARREPRGARVRSDAERRTPNAERFEGNVKLSTSSIEQHLDWVQVA